METIDELKARIRRLEAENAELRMVLEAIERNAPQENAPTLTPIEFAFWFTGTLARTALAQRTVGGEG